MNATAEAPRPMCIGCGKHPDELREYIAGALACECTPEEYVRQEEGTYNPDNGHFLCDACYIAAGMPGLAGGWVAP